MIVLTLLLWSLWQVEANGDLTPPPNGKCVGIYQMKPIQVREANRVVGYERWHDIDRESPVESTAMATAIIQRWMEDHPAWTAKDMAFAWRMGVKNYTHATHITDEEADYARRVWNLYHEQTMHVRR